MPQRNSDSLLQPHQILTADLNLQVCALASVRHARAEWSCGAKLLRIAFQHCGTADITQCSFLEVWVVDGGNRGFLVASAQAIEAVSALVIVTIPL